MARRARTIVVALAIAFQLMVFAAPATADDYDPEEAGHPLRIIAYVVHPVGVILDWLIFRPAHWLVSHDPMKTLFGHTDD